MNKFGIKVGSTFSVDLVVTEVPEFNDTQYTIDWADAECYTILGEIDYTSLSEEEILMLADGNYRERRRLQEIKTLEHKLSKLKGEDVE